MVIHDILFHVERIPKPIAYYCANIIITQLFMLNIHVVMYNFYYREREDDDFTLKHQSTHSPSNHY